MKRIRHVHPTDAIAGLWAEQRQDSARNNSERRKNFHFSGKKLFSYSTEVAGLYELKGVKFSAVNLTYYSNNTRKHQRDALCSAPGLVVRYSLDRKGECHMSAEDIVLNSIDFLCEQMARWQFESEKMRARSAIRKRYRAEWIEEHMARIASYIKAWPGMKRIVSKAKKAEAITKSMLDDRWKDHRKALDEAQARAVGDMVHALSGQKVDAHTAFINLADMQPRPKVKLNKKNLPANTSRPDTNGEIKNETVT